MLALLAIFDGIIIGMLVFYFIAFLLGDKPFARLLILLLGIISGIAYFCLCAELNYGEMATEVSILTGCLVFFGPVGLIAILWVIYYMFKDK